MRIDTNNRAELLHALQWGCDKDVVEAFYNWIEAAKKGEQPGYAPKPYKKGGKKCLNVH